MIKKFLLVSGTVVLGYTSLVLADFPSQSLNQMPVTSPSKGQPTVWNIPVINQGDDSSWTVGVNNLEGTKGGAENIAQEDLNAERFPEVQSSDPDMVFPGDNSFEDLNMGSDFDAPLMESLGEK